MYCTTLEVMRLRFAHFETGVTGDIGGVMSKTQDVVQ